jgi:predicted metal-dependent hydrolase
MATSPPHYYKYTISDGELKCYKCSIVVNYSKSEVLDKLKENGFIAEQDDTFRYKEIQDNEFKGETEKNVYFKIKEIVIDNDRITNFQFALEYISNTKTKIWINGMNVDEEITDKNVERQLRRYYRKLIKKEINNLTKNN